ncbi:MAG: tryptophan--tRNA ligase, partial [Candidatus Omnitrophica bacterium]|nr:tryptophan--tRNA ligase [Candidatus Omnitrophota bacterium]
AVLTKEKRLLGLDGRKMSKSYNNYIALSEQPEAVAKKIQNMFTDPTRIKFSDPGHPQNCNVHSYYAVFAPERKKEIDELCRKAQIGCTDCKKELAKIIIKFLEPIQEKRNELLRDKGKVFDILAQGEKKAQAAACATISEVRNLVKL